MDNLTPGTEAPTIDPKELKTAREWLNYLPEHIRSEAIEACEKWPNVPNEKCRFQYCIGLSFYLAHIDNIDKWRQIINQLYSGEILPVSPEQALPDFYVGMEIVAKDVALSGITSGKPYKVDAIVNDTHLKIMNDHNKDFYIYIENFHKYFTVAKPSQVTEEKQAECTLLPEFNKSNETEKLNPSMAITPPEVQIEALRNEIEQLRKELDARCPKPIEATPAPEPQANKLPVTKDEVTEYCKSLEGNGTEFYRADAVICFLTEKAHKKLKATTIIMQIAEAQNAQAERGEWIWIADRNASGQIVTDDYRIGRAAGAIIFHSEQGLKDCIAANEQLFRDYLEI